MKWILVLLFAMNVSLGLVQWFKARDMHVQAVYTESDSIAPIILLGVGSEKTTQSGERCLLVGPMHDQEKSQQLLAVLRGKGVVAKSVVRQVEKAPGYWVYYGPFEGGDAALKQLREFQDKAIDSFIIRSGFLKGNISLGVFENIDSARRMKKIMKRKGYETKMQEIAKSEDEFWLLISGAETDVDFSRSAAILKGLRGVPEMRQIFCKSVASEK